MREEKRRAREKREGTESATLIVRLTGRDKEVMRHVTCPPFLSTYCASPRQRFEYSIGVDPNSELCGLFSL